MRDGLDGENVLSDVLANLAITSSGSFDQGAVLVGERDSKPVDLGLTKKRAASDPLTPSQELVLVEGVIQAQHALEVSNRVEYIPRCGANGLGWRIFG